jgi:Polysaccharide lyase
VPLLVNAAPNRLRRVLMLAAAVATLAAVFATAHARPAEAPAPPQSLDKERDKWPARRGVILFKGDFEPGDVSQWNWGAQCANTGVPSSGSSVRGTITVQSEIVAQGKYAARIDLPGASVYTACETLTRRRIGVGTNDYYGMMVRFPTVWQKPSPSNNGLVIAQLNFQNIWGSPVSLRAHADHVALTLSSGLCNSVFTSKPGCAYSSGPGGNVKPMLAVSAPLALGVWHQLIIHVRWATDSSGVLEVWHRLKGSGNWRKTVVRRGNPTLQWTRKVGRRRIANATTADKIGAYRGHSTFPLAIWHDGFVRTRSFAATAAALAR